MGLWNKLWAAVFGEKPVAEPVRRVGAAPPISEEESRETYGATPSDPILCDQPIGERLYIATLRCPGGHRLVGSRRGSMSGKCSDPRHHVSLFADEKPDEVCIVDCYDLVCEGGEYSCALYFDMYHPGAPPQPAPRGLTRA